MLFFLNVSFSQIMLGLCDSAVIISCSVPQVSLWFWCMVSFKTPAYALHKKIINRKHSYICCIASSIGHTLKLVFSIFQLRTWMQCLLTRMTKKKREMSFRYKILCSYDALLIKNRFIFQCSLNWVETLHWISWLSF